MLCKAMKVEHVPKTIYENDIERTEEVQGLSLGTLQLSEVRKMRWSWEGRMEKSAPKSGENLECGVQETEGKVYFQVEKCSVKHCSDKLKEGTRALVKW